MVYIYIQTNGGNVLSVFLGFHIVVNVVDIFGRGGGGISGVAVDVIAGTRNVVAHFLVSSDTFWLVNGIIKSKNIVLQGLQQEYENNFFLFEYWFTKKIYYMTLTFPFSLPPIQK